RLQAIRTYTEVMDYFPNEIWIAVPALYFRAEAYFENGDDLQGYKSLQAIAEDDGYLKHPLAAGALRRLADNHWANQQFDQAATTWKRAWDSYHKTNRDEAGSAAANLRACYMIQGQFDRLTAFVAKLAEADPQMTECDALLRALSQARSGLHSDHGWNTWYYERFHNDSQARAMMDESRKQIYEWFVATQAQFTNENRLYDYHGALAGFAAEEKVGDAGKHATALCESLKAIRSKPDVAIATARQSINDLAHNGHRPNASRVFETASGIIRSANVNADEKEKLASLLVGTLAERGMRDEAVSLLDLYVDGTRALWAEFSIHERSREWQDALATLDKIENLKQADDLRRARQQRADIYHNHIGEYQKAIEVYRQIADPPGTLWSIQDCQRRDGKTDAAITTLTEIASLFPDQAPRAVFTKAEYYRADGKHKL
ncbi:MAG: hypothetical protein MI741_10800, partial [Rhodospirillales bacterium]|nr:hypothetical protein [Rhodospirillales bacterium]